MQTLIIESKDPNCIWADSREIDGETEVFCTHSSNEGGYCKLAQGEGCEYQIEGT